MASSKDDIECTAAEDSSLEPNHGRTTTMDQLKPVTSSIDLNSIETLIQLITSRVSENAVSHQASNWYDEILKRIDVLESVRSDLKEDKEALRKERQEEMKKYDALRDEERQQYITLREVERQNYTALRDAERTNYDALKDAEQQRYADLVEKYQKLDAQRLTDLESKEKLHQATLSAQKKVFEDQIKKMEGRDRKLGGYLGLAIVVILVVVLCINTYTWWYHKADFLSPASGQVGLLTSVCQSGFLIASAYTCPRNPPEVPAPVTGLQD